MAKPILDEGLWAVLELLLPPDPPRPRGGRPRLPARQVLTGILFVLRSCIPWELLPQELGCGSGITCWRRLQEWQAQGLWQRIHHELLNWLGQLDELDWRRASLDSGSVPAKRGGPLTGPNPTDRGKAGTKRHLVVERQGIPLAVKVTAASERYLLQGCLVAGTVAGDGVVKWIANALKRWQLLSLLYGPQSWRSRTLFRGYGRWRPLWLRADGQTI